MILLIFLGLILLKIGMEQILLTIPILQIFVLHTQISYNHLPIPSPSWGGGGVYQYPRTGRVVATMIIYSGSASADRRYSVGKFKKK